MENNLQKQSYTIGNVHCSSCEGKVIKLIQALDGVLEVTVNVLRKKMYVTFDAEKIEGAKLTTAVATAMQQGGYTATPLSSSASSAEEEILPSAPKELFSPFTMAPAASATAPFATSEKNTPLQEQAFLLHKAHCASCQGKIHAALMALDGIEEAQVNTLRRSVVVKYNPEILCPATIIEAFADGKYKLQEVEKNALPPLIPLIGDVKQKKLPKKSSPVETAQIHEALQPSHKAPQGHESALEAPVEKEKVNKIQEQHFKIGNVHCTSCEDRVQKLLLALGGVHSIQVNILRKTMHVHYDSTCIDAKGIAAAMEGAGYSAAPMPARNIQKKNAQAEDSPQDENVDKACCSKKLATASQEALSHEALDADPSQRMPMSLLSSLFFAAVLMYVAMAPMFSLALPPWLTPFGANMAASQNWALAQALLCLPILIINKKIFISGCNALKQKSPNMDSLVGLGSLSAALFGCFALTKIYGVDSEIIHYYGENLYFDSAGMILALIGLGKYFESKARSRAGSAIDSLIRLTPSTTLCLRHGEEVTIATADIVPGDILVVHAGQSLAADGIITQGHAFIDTSVITGESLPQEKKVGDTVIGATVSQSGYFHMRVTKTGQDTALAHIIDLVESATASKAPIARLADKIAAVFVPIIILIALLTLGTWLFLGQSLEFAMSAAIAVLVISCPCALGLATPTAIMVGMGLGAERGILFKSAAALERLQAVDTVILDKTGTLTEGKPSLTDIHACENYQEDQLLLWAASLEKLSEHPLGKAIIQAAEAKGLSLLAQDTFTNFTQLPGLGIMATMQSPDAETKEARLLAGNARFLLKENIANPFGEKEKEWARHGKTVLYVAHNDTLVGLVAVADTVKKTSKGAVQNLKKLGLNILMLTGDNAHTAKAVQHQVDIETIVAEVLPAEKAEQVQKLEDAGHKVAMVGDGINDAPALASAHVGIAIGAGTDIAIQSADIVLMQSDVEQVSSALHLSKATMRTIKQNLFWAFAYNILLIPVAAGFFSSFGLMLSPMLAAASMSISSLTVVGNALRLRLQKRNIF